MIEGFGGRRAEAPNAPLASSAIGARVAALGATANSEMLADLRDRIGRRRPPRDAASAVRPKPPPQLPDGLGFRHARSKGRRQACGATSWWTDFGPHESGA